MATASPTLTGIPLAQLTLQIVGNASSAAGSMFIAGCYVWLLPARVRDHFRHRMILNLAIADAMNGCVGLFSQFYKLATHGKGLRQGVACRVDGVVVQLSTQAVDISIFAIALVTVLAVTRPHYFEQWSAHKSITITLATWAMPVATSLLVLALNKYEPATGGWCWVATKPAFLRYAVTHAWRYLIIITIVALYSYLYFFLKRHFRNIAGVARGLDPSSPTTSHQLGSPPHPNDSDGNRGMLGPESSISLIQQRDDINGPFSSTPRTPTDITGQGGKGGWGGRRGGGGGGENKPCTLDTAKEHKDKYRKIRKVLLMKAYPISYVVLWIPGLLNRIIEASGNSSHVMELLQTSTAFIGLANAITYGWNEGIAREIRLKMLQWQGAQNSAPLH